MSHSKRVRPRYFSRQRLHAEDLALEQQYQDARHRRHTRMLHGWGMVCGGEVVLTTGASPTAPGAGPTSRVRVQAGYGITPLGDEIIIPADLGELDITDLLTDACPSDDSCELDGPTDGLHTLYLIARPRTVPCAVAPPLPPDCGHPGSDAEVSRLRDDVQFALIKTLSDVHTPGPLQCTTAQLLVCNDYIPTCPPLASAADNYLVLARLVVVRALVLEIQIFPWRRRLFSIALIQEHLRCACLMPAATTAPPTTTSPPTTTAPPTTTRPPSTTAPPFFTTRPGTLIPETIPPRITIDPGIIGGAVTLGPGDFDPSGPVTNPGPLVDAGIIHTLDPAVFDVAGGLTQPVNTIEGITAEDAVRLETAGIHNAAELYAADTQVLVNTLGASPVRAAGLRLGALDRMRRR